MRIEKFPAISTRVKLSQKYYTTVTPREPGPVSRFVHAIRHRSTSMSTFDQLEKAKAAVVQISGGCRGFIVGAGLDRFILTAAHCVPDDRLPTPHLWNGPRELAFPDFIGPVGDTPTIRGELCVYGLTDDIAAFSVPSSDIEDEYERI